MVTIPLLKDDPAFGSIAALGRACCVSKQAASKWNKVPAEYCLAVEAATDGRFTRYQLRPDVFGHAPTVGIAAEGTGTDQAPLDQTSEAA
jgi:DNA-binding transcriptional regulator YdaS (Cro superfamily)